MWGDPQVKCIPCNCNPSGVDPNNVQCDTVTGKCHCLEGLLCVRVTCVRFFGSSVSFFA